MASWSNSLNPHMRNFPPNDGGLSIPTAEKGEVPTAPGASLDHACLNAGAAGDKLPKLLPILVSFNDNPDWEKSTTY